MYIKYLKQHCPEIYERVLEIQREQKSMNESEKLEGSFNWLITTEGYDVWNQVNAMNTAVWYEFHRVKTIQDFQKWHDIENKDEVESPDYYDNSKGSLYKIAQDRGWTPYTFDVVKRLDRGGKKDPLRQEIEKSIVVLQLWLKELED